MSCNLYINNNIYIYIYSESELIHSLYYGIKKTSNAKRDQRNFDLVISSLRVENYLVYKLKEYLLNSELCVNEYKMSCGEFLVSNLEKALKFIEERLSSNKVNNEIIIKHLF